MAQALGERIRSSLIMKLLVVFGLVLVLRIPVRRVENLVGEREETRAVAESEVRQSWGGVQCIEAPLLAIPYEDPSPWIRPEGQDDPTFVVLRAEALDVRASLTSFVRTRGIFDILLYDAELYMGGSFLLPVGVPYPVPAERLRWEAAEMVFIPAPGRELPEAIEVGGRRVSLRPGPFEGYVSAPLALSGAPTEAVSFAVAMKLRGSGALLFRTAPNTTSVEVESDWPHPKFVGVLASSHDIGAGGFTARWQLRGASSSPLLRWDGREAIETKAERSFGVELLQPVDSYRMTRRSIKYEFLFTALTLGMFFVIEVFGARRIHPIQYLLVGGALVLFYLLVLSLAEHIGFGAAYAVSSVAVVALIADYAAAALESRRRASAVGGLLVGLYGFLYVLLALQEFSLLVGSVGIFSILATIMFTSRRVDWYELGKTRG